MFTIQYKITDEDLKHCRYTRSAKEFDDRKNWIYGQFLMKANNSEIGFIHDDLEYDGENLTVWFMNLNKVILKSRNDKYVTISISDWDDSWIEFCRIDDHSLMLSEIEAHLMNTNEYVISGEFNKKTVVWSENISLENFINATLKSTESFLEEVKCINSVLSETREIVCLRELYNCVKTVQNNLYKR